ncbi:MAG: hypothetical protein ACRDCW_02360 [Sarcina sp.]
MNNKVITGGVTVFTLLILTIVGVVNRFVCFIDNNSFVGESINTLSNIGIFAIVAITTLHLVFCIFDFIDYVVRRNKR